MKRFVSMLLALLTLAAPALAECPVKVEISLGAYRFSGPGRVEVTIAVTNASGADMPGPCALYDPTGRRIEDFGTPTLSAGERADWTGTWQVTEEQLRQGRLVFALMWVEADDSGALVPRQQAFYTPITRTVTLVEQQLAQVTALCFSHAVSLLGRAAFLDFHVAGQP